MRVDADVDGVCRDHLRRACRRGRRCRFEHPAGAEETGSAGTDDRVAPVCKDYLKGECRRGAQCRYRHLTLSDHQRQLATGCDPRGLRDNRFAATAVAPWDELALLRQRVAALDKRVNDLAAANEFLLDQNARLRREPTFAVPVSIATITPVSLATVSPVVTMTTVSVAPVAMQPPVVTMAQTITVDGCPSSTSLLSYPTLTRLALDSSAQLQC